MQTFVHNLYPCSLMYFQHLVYMIKMSDIVSFIHCSICSVLCILTLCVECF